MALRGAHVLLGESASASFRQSGVAADRGDVFTLQDSLSCGPLQPIEDTAAWTNRRRGYWRSILGLPDDLDEGLYANPDGLRSRGSITLWLGTELGDQMALAWLPAFLGAPGVRRPAIDVVQFHRNARGLEIPGLGMISPAEFASHAPAVTLTPGDLTELDVVWRALTSPTPDGLISYLGAATSHFPLLERALREGLTRYPDATSGLSAWDASLLHGVARGGPKCSRVIGDTLARSYRALFTGPGGLDQVGDIWLYWRMWRLADLALREPALEIEGSRTEYFASEVRLTPFGRRILEGKANFVDANGIDDCVFGVHLQSEAGRVWFHRDGNLIRR